MGCVFEGIMGVYYWVVGLFVFWVGFIWGISISGFFGAVGGISVGFCLGEVWFWVEIVCSPGQCVINMYYINMYEGWLWGV